MTSRFENVRLRKSTKKGKKTKKKAPESSIDDLLKAASAAMESLDVERAYETYSHAATRLQGADNEKHGVEDLIHVLEKMGELQVSMGDQDLAKDHFVRCLGLLEERGKKDSAKDMSYYETRSNLCFYIGQLSLEKEALDAYQNGITSLEKCMQLVADGQEIVAMQDESDETTNHNEEAILKQKLSGAYCNIAELYLTDLCEEETAESDCEQYLEKALQLKDSDGEPLVDALQTMASLRLSQQERQSEAIPFVLRAYEKQRVGSEALATLVGLGEKTTDDDAASKGQAQELLEVEAANNLPEFEFRCQTAKLLLECAGLDREESGGTDQANECIAAAISVLGSLLAQNDEVIEIWYLTGCAFAAKQPPLVDAAKFYLERAKEMLTDIQKALKDELQYADDSEKQELQEQLEMNATQMSDVQSKLGALPDAVEDMEEG
ncbi:unnamed protein product [Pseudo-nitzschia multistriata]|uniref:Uncharacterized protein n=1 Tax=Pseudo-nitzschia multistriata TaxID=183589 RepID=A0A448Z188_9STRA|nr:unnamed protein product [Pseudo-nitzschia multistriata]